MGTETVEISITGPESDVKLAISELQELEGVETVRAQNDTVNSNDRLLSRKSQSYAELIEIGLTIVTNLGFSYLYDYLKSKGLEVKKREKSEEDSSDDNDTKS